jgi:hypothetical protein
MKFDCFVTSGVEIDIRPASSRRDWMGATADRFAYRCLPLSIANAHGWVIGCGGGFEAEWNGGDAPQDVRVFPSGDGEVEARGHFGYGTLTIAPLAVFRTEPDHNLWITGPPNAFKDGIQPLSAVVESDWIPYHFTMNWKFTRPHHRIRFEKGEPYCFLFPIKRGLPEAMEPVLRDLDEDPEINRHVEYANSMRFFVEKVNLIRGMRETNAEIRNEKQLKFQKWYMQGHTPDGDVTFEAHQKSLQIADFQDARRKERS